MTQFSYIRIDRELVVPTTSIFSDLGNFVSILVPGFEKPFSFDGDSEIAAGLRMFLEGTRVFKVTPNGVLDLYSSLVAGHQAERAFSQTPVERPIEETILDARSFLTQDVSPGPKSPRTHDSPVPLIDVDAIARGIKGRK